MLDLTKKPYNLNQKQIEYIKNTIDKMTVDEKVGQLFFVIGQDEDTVNITEFIKKYKPGGMMYRPDCGQKLRREFSEAQTASRFPLFMAANLESGGNGLVREGTWLGTPMQMAATNDPQSAYELGNVAGSEASQVGCNMSFAPIVDIDKNFRNPIMNTRTFGSDQNRVLEMSKAQIKGLSENNIIPVIKHFPGDGVDERDQHLLSSINSLSTDQWMNSYGKIYQDLIDEGISSIMIAHILQPAWEKKLQPEIKNEQLRPASCSKPLIEGLLRKVLNFNGLAITDATPMLGYNTTMHRKDLLPATINAGIDMILFNKNIDEDYEYIHQAIKNKVLPMERIDEAVMRILGTKIAQNIMDTNDNFVQEIPQKIDLKKEKHQKIAQKIAKNSVTLVKDRDNLLPITPKKYKKIRLVVLGDSDDGGFKEGGHVTNLFKDQLETKGFDVTLFDHTKLDFHEIFEEGVCDLEKKFDLALYVANIETASNQTTTRLDWVHLMAADAPWFLKSIPTVFVSTANPYHLFDVPDVSTFINSYTGNNETIEATIRKLMGEEQFTGINPIDPFCGDFRAEEL